jgi:superfamily II DNA or RNA helicase
MAQMSGEELTRDFLMDAGGWKEMKAAREMHRAGLVVEASFEGGVLEGMVKTGGKAKKVRMVIHSRTDMDNKCSCFLARRDGRVCSHAVAVGLEVIAPTVRAVAEEKEVVPEEKVESLWPRLVEEAEEGARSITCSVMLPLKMAETWTRGQIMIGVGVRDEEGVECLLGQLGKEDLLLVGERDARLLEKLQELFPAQPPGVVTLEKAAFLKLLEGLAGHPRVLFGKKESAQVNPVRRRLPLRCSDFKLKAVWPREMTALIEGGVAWGLVDKEFVPVALGLPEKWTRVLGKGTTVGEIDAPRVLRGLAEWFEISDEVWKSLPQELTPTVELRLEGSLNHVDGTLVFLYGTHRIPAGSEEAKVVTTEEGSGLTSPILERVAEDVLRAHGFDGPNGKGVFALRDRDAILQFHAYGVKRLQAEWTVILGERFREFAKDVVPVVPEFSFRGSGEDWFSLEASYRVGEGKPISRDEVQRILQMGKTGERMKNGKVAVVDAALVEQVSETLLDCDSVQDGPGVFRFDHKQAAYLQNAARELGVRSKGAERWAPAEEEAGLDDSLGALATVLRPYQREGVEWLWRLAGAGMGGILADDMGLGKTLQTLAFLKARGGQNLVVCPSSLVSNWVAEAKKFVPELTVLAAVGPKRKKLIEEHWESADLIVTSYAVMRIDAEQYAEWGFGAVVLDEAQQIKNPESQVAKAAFGLQAEFRLALTGTPVENSAGDLWAIMNFALPGYLGGRKEFAERFVKPLQKGDAELMARLARRMRPVMMRRMKSEVAKDLPEKIELVRYCDLTKKQNEVYEGIARESRALVDEAEGGRKRMVALTALLRLRQACCDLRLLGMEDLEEGEASVKLKVLEEILQEAVAGGHRVLVFSQFVKLLQGLVPMLAGNGWKFSYLDGQSKNRGEIVERFQEDESIPLFLISLKAGGVGLNLTGADTVVHLDPWWNPAVEAQATDRAHRIGQTRVVTSCKLITRGTVEEKILALQEKKRAMMEGLLAKGDVAAVSGLSEAEVMGLF